jgi:spore germination protein GerM
MTSPAASRRRLWITIGIGAACVLGGVALVLITLPRWFGHGASGSADTASQTATGEARKIHATLFYVSDDGSELVPVSREVPYGATPAEQARRIAEAQVQTPPQGTMSAIPAGTAVRGLYITSHGDAYLDLSKEIVTGHSGGSLDEALAIYAIVDALTANLADVTAVQILIDGKQVDTLVGHLDLRHPLPKSLKWVRRGQ